MTTGLIQWLLESDEPWTRYRTLVDWGCPEDDAQARAAPQVKTLMPFGKKPERCYNRSRQDLASASLLHME